MRFTLLSVFIVFTDAFITSPQCRPTTDLNGVSKRARKKANLELQTSSGPLKRPGDQDNEGVNVSPNASGLKDTTTKGEATQKVVVDSETGLRMISEGRAVMDVLTKQPVKLASTTQGRNSEFMPRETDEERSRLRLSKPKVEDLVEGLKGSIANLYQPVDKDSVAWVLSNRDYMGVEMKRALTAVKLKMQSEGREDEAREYKALRDAYVILENYISSPFRQQVLTSESRVGPNFSNLDITSYAGDEECEVRATWVVLQGMRSVWEKKTRDQRYYEGTKRDSKNTMEYLSRGDPNRFNSDSDRKFYPLEDTERMTGWAQNMASTFSSNPTLMGMIGRDMRFVDKAILVEGGTEVRRIAYEFAKEEGIEVEELREGVKRLLCQLENMQPDPYGKFTRIVNDVVKAMEVGTDDERSIYGEWLYSNRKDGPGWFQTYRMPESDLSMLRFLENEVDVKEGGLGPMDEVFKQLGFGGVVEKVQGRKDDRPEGLGWIDILDDEIKEEEVVEEVEFEDEEGDEDED
mmetsp:Transcript_24059/g.50158  ORF Transcript_24059/g.50158 Transcript_24059/m.50158 type:complete len:519 (+) Transcript_24059:1-1557(+)